MALDQATMRRLAFIRYLLNTAVSQSKAPPPLSCASLLTMHDSVELFLQLASEHLNTGASQPGFMEYWEILNRKLKPKELQQRESMRRLNKARVALKHNGTFPSELDIEAFRGSTLSFFEDNTPLVFDLSFGSISLVEFVQPQAAREKLRDAQEDIENGDTLEALDKIAIAFGEMVADYEDRKRGRFRSPFHFVPDLTFLSSFHMGLSRSPLSLNSLPFERDLAEFVDIARESLKAMSEALRVLALGLDYRRFSRFKLLTPSANRVMNGEWVIDRRFEDELPSVEEARFCFDFVIESALVLAEFDYTTQNGLSN